MRQPNSYLLLCLSLLLIGSFALNNIQKGYYHSDFNLDRGFFKEEKEPLTPTEIRGINPKEEQITKNKGEIILSSIDGLNSGQVKLLNDYYNEFFSKLAQSSPADLKQFYYQRNLDSTISAEIDQIYYDLKLNLYKNSNVDLKISDYKVNVDIVDIQQINNNEIEITVSENQDINYNGVEGTSYGRFIENRFRIIKDGDTYKMANHEEGNALIILIRHILNTKNPEPGNQMATLAQIRKELLDNFNKENKSLDKALEENRNQKNTTVDNGTYNREAAVNYANEYFDKRNPKYFDYSEYGGNCNNFVSQCLIAGGINEDMVGDYIWYGSNGDTDSWILVDNFYEYLSRNHDSGFKVDLDDNFFSGQKGDIIQLGYDDEWLHSVIITDVVKDKEGNTIDYLVNSNSLDYKNFPLSAYGYPKYRLIKILGNN